MYRRTNIPAPDNEFDAGIKPYLTNDDYETLQRTYTAAEAQNTEPYPESEIAPSYLDDESPCYEATEYAWPHGIDWPDVPWPELPPLVWPGGLPRKPSPWSISFSCNFLDCYCPGKETCMPLRCSQRVIGVEFEHEPPPGISVRVSGGKLCVDASEDAHGAFEVNIVMVGTVNDVNGPKQIVGRAYSKNISECVDWKCQSCDCSLGLTWDTETSAETVAPNSSCTVAVSDAGGKCGPFTWTVSGTGFSLENETTIGPSNTLIADASACGSAEINVIGCDGKTGASGFVRCTIGRWIAGGICYDLVGSGYCPFDEEATAYESIQSFGPYWKLTAINGRCKASMEVIPEFCWEPDNWPCPDCYSYVSKEFLEPGTCINNKNHLPVGYAGEVCDICDLCPSEHYSGTTYVRIIPSDKIKGVYTWGC